MEIEAGFLDGSSHKSCCIPAGMGWRQFWDEFFVIFDGKIKKNGGSSYFWRCSEDLAMKVRKQALVQALSPPAFPGRNQQGPVANSA
jgi:hypothetical protein